MNSKFRAVDMDALKSFAEFFNESDYTVKVFTSTSAEIRTTQMKAIKQVFLQCKKAGSFSKEAKFQEQVVNESDIHDRVL